MHRNFLPGPFHSHFVLVQSRITVVSRFVIQALQQQFELILQLASTTLHVSESSVYAGSDIYHTFGFDLLESYAERFGKLGHGCRGFLIFIHKVESGAWRRGGYYRGSFYGRSHARVFHVAKNLIHPSV